MPVNLLLLVLLLPTLLATKVFDCNNEYSNGNPFTDVIDPPIHINTWSDNADMSSSTETRSRVILVTGSTDGIGKQTALEIASARPQDTVIVHGRTQAKADAAIKYIRSKSQHGDQLQLESVIGDFESLQQVAKMAQNLRSRFPRLDVLVNNAGVLRKKTGETKENGLEITFQVNHLSPFLLTLLLLPSLHNAYARGTDTCSEQNTACASASSSSSTSSSSSSAAAAAAAAAYSHARIVHVSSMCHSWEAVDWGDLQSRQDYEIYVAYARSKLYNVLFSNELAQRCEESKLAVTSNALEPGVIQTKLLAVGGFSGSSLSVGSKCPVYLSSSPRVENVNGKYFDHKTNLEVSCKDSRDKQSQRRLWQESINIIKTQLDINDDGDDGGVGKLLKEALALLKG